MKKLVTKVLCVLLITCLIICTLSGCTRISYEEAKENEWQSVFVSIIGNEKLVISRRHDNGLLGVHNTEFLIELFEGEECTYYRVDTHTVCPRIIWFHCCGDMATMDMAAEKSGPMAVLYPYIQDIMSYMMLQDIINGNITSEQLKMILADDVFNTVIDYQVKDTQAQMLGDAMGKILDVNEYVSMLNELYTSISDSADAKQNSKDAESAAEYYSPVTPELVEGFKTASFAIFVYQTDIDNFFNSMKAGNAADKTKIVKQKTADAQKELHRQFKEIAYSV